MTKIELKSAPDVARVIRAAFPGYKKHNAYLMVFRGGVSVNSYWDSGSRAEFAVVDMATGRRAALPTQSHPYFDIARAGMANTADAHVAVDARGNVTLRHLPEGFALVQAGVSCGKPATAWVYVPAENMARLLGAGVSA